MQEPRISVVAPYASSSGREAVALARMVGLDLDPWQEMDLVDAMGEAPTWKCSKCTFVTSERVLCPDHPAAPMVHPWSAFEVVEVCTRQNGKSELLIARMLAGLFILGERLQIFSAHEFDTAIEIYRRLKDYILSCDELRARVKHRGSKLVGIRDSHGEEGIELEDGCRVRFKARTGSGGRGFTCDCLYLDEAMVLPEFFLGSVVPTLSARPNPQIWIAGSAPDQDNPTHDGIVMAKRRVRALAGDSSRLAYFERSADFDGDPDDVPGEVLDDPAQWAQGNPALGRRISAEYVAGERKSMGARQFAVERLGITRWPDVSADAGRVIGRSLWGSLAERDETAKITSGWMFAVDVNPERSRTSIGVAGQRGDGLAQFAVVAHDRGIGWVRERCGELAKSYPGAEFLILARGHALNLTADLEADGLSVTLVDGNEYGAACADFFDQVQERKVRYPWPQPDLDEALAGARKSTNPESAWTWSRKASTSPDISPLVAVTVALWGAQQRGVPQVWDIGEVMAQMRREQDDETPAEAPQGASEGISEPGFVRWDEAQLPSRAFRW